MVRRFFLPAALATLALIAPRRATADTTLTFDGMVQKGGLDHEFVDFQVPAGVAEIQVDHDDMSDVDILDWGLNDPNGFRGWGGGNTEPAIVTELAASRSYLPGPIVAGTWRVVVGKAKITGSAVAYHIVVTLRNAPTLAPQPERKPYAPSAPLSTEARWYAGDLHAHSRESGDAEPTIDDLVTFARSQGLDFVELSDHNTVSQLEFIDSVQANHPDILILPGVEYTTYSGHANGIGATKWVDHKIGQPGVTIQGAAQAFRDQGALFSINHPLYDLGQLCIGCSWKHDLDPGAIDAVEIATAGTGDLFGQGTLDFWDGLSDGGRHLAAVGGSDDHSAGMEAGMFSTPVGTPTTYVFANDLSAAAILEGIRNGRTVVKFHGVTDPMVEISSAIPIDGDTIHAATTKLHARITGGNGLTARWVVDGAPDESTDVTSDDFDLVRDAEAPMSGQDRYRVEVLRNGLPTTVTSHVWLEFKAGVEPPVGGDDASAAGGCDCAVTNNGTLAGGGSALAFVALAFGKRRRTSRRGGSSR